MPRSLRRAFVVALVVGAAGRAAADDPRAGLRSDDPAVRLAAATRLAQTPGTVESLAAQLYAPTSIEPQIFRKLFLEMWAQVPNWKSGTPLWIRKPEPPWTPPPRVPGQPRPKRPPPHDPEQVDWLPALAALDLAPAAALDPDTLIPPVPGAPKPPPPPPDAPPPEPPPPTPLPVLVEARAVALEKVALLRALAATQKLEAAEPLFRYAFEVEGVFRDECGRQVRALGELAVPPLVRLRAEKGAKLAKQRRYAGYQLDRLDRQDPRRALLQSPDDRVRALLLHAYGEALTLEAVEPVLEWVDATSRRVAREARWAFLQYVDGPPPPPPPKRKRKLGGGREESQERPDYLTYRERADLVIRERLRKETGEAPPAGTSAAELARQLFARLDARAQEPWQRRLAEGRAREEAGDLAGAIEIYGEILEHVPEHAERASMAGAFERRGDALWPTSRAGAAALYRVAVTLSDSPPPRVAARLALFDATQPGADAPYLLARAAALDPSLTEAARALRSAERRDLLRRSLSIAGVFTALGLAAALAWLARRRAR